MRDITAEILISPSGLATAQFCERQWSYTYVRGLRGPPSQIVDNAEGVLMHAGLYAWATGSAPTPKHREDAIRAEAASGWDGGTPTDRHVLGAIRATEIALGWVVERYPERVIEGAEEEVRAPHPDDPTIVLTGKLDLRLWVPDPGTWGGGRRILIDYKRRSRIGAGDKAIAARGLDLIDTSAWHDHQSHHYAAILRALGQPVDESGLLVVKGAAFDSKTGRPAPIGRQWVVTTGSDRALDAHLAAVAGRVARLRAQAAGELQDDRRFGDCWSYGRPCPYAGLCRAERDGDELGALVEVTRLEGLALGGEDTGPADLSLSDYAG